MRWRECLDQILERGGGLEIAIDHAPTDTQPSTDEQAGDRSHAPATGGSLVWRVRLYEVTDSSLTLEMPGALGSSFRIAAGTPLRAVMSIGQNRWMFSSSALGETQIQVGRRFFPALRIATPTEVERCRRRITDRLSTSEFQLPSVQCWTLLDPDSAIPAELANRARINELLKARSEGEPSAALEAALLPAVGPSSPGMLANIGGGGIGVRFEQHSRIDLDTRNLYWMRLDLRPWIPAPLAVTARLAHVHTDSTQTRHAGFAFDFSHNPEHRTFIIEQVECCMRLMQTVPQRKAA
ncbi:MAG: hypothetical protein DYG94_07560 [Leptolyngbya sp. PLA3]|nr:MAG: hypothetical protein EDM82_10535 [Cyanobacteria bacterium CYA]MCE7968587.1 hypothetical protein [Leptolyngbya sp. PL-A3]